MKSIKVKPKTGAPKMLNRAAQIPNGIRAALVTSKNKIQGAASEEKNATPTNYAEDKLTEKSREYTQKGADAAQRGAKKIKNTIQKRAQRAKTAGKEKAAPEPHGKAGGARQAQESHRQVAYAGREAAKRPVEASPATPKGAQATQTGVKRTTGTASKTAPKTAQKAAIKTARATRNTVKTANRTVKTGTRTIKTAKATGRAAVKAARIAQRAAVRAARIAAQVARAVIRAAIAAVKALIRLTIAALKALITALATFGWPVLLIIIIIAVVAAIFSSAFGIFKADEATQNGRPISAVMQEINTEYLAQIQRDVDAKAGAANTEFLFSTGTEGDSDIENNWTDVLGIFAVETTMNAEDGADVVEITPEKAENLKALFFDMNSYTVNVETVTEESPKLDKDGKPMKDKQGNPVMETTEKQVVTVEVKTQSWEEAAAARGFNAEQMAMLCELMSGEYASLFAEVTGIDVYGGLTPEEAAKINANLPIGTAGGVIAQEALRYVGCPYSQERRGQGNYVDCSYLTMLAYRAAGINIPGTSVEQAQYCVDGNKLIGRDQLQVGDLIFWTKTTCHCGRYQEIHHVAVYLGDGRIVEASSSKGKVVVGNLWETAKWQIVFCARPHV